MKTVHGVTYYCKSGWKVLGKPYMECLPIQPPSGDIITPFITLRQNGHLHLPAEYAWDGASGPTWDTKSSIRPALGHDVGYQLIRLGFLPMSYRIQFDDLLLTTCIQDGMWHWRAEMWYRNVRRFGEASARPIDGE